MSTAKLPIEHIANACQTAADQRLAQIATDQAAHRVTAYDDSFGRITKLHALAVAASRAVANNGVMTVGVEDFWAIKDHYKPEG